MLRYDRGMATTHPTTRISSGDLIGREASGVHRYLGIAFAAPPFGENRFALPVAPEPWNEPFDAAAFGPTSPQTPYAGRLGTLLESISIPGENVLTLNVWAPADAASLPVVIWYHGGAFERGGAAISLYDGTPFARDGVVYVSANYRLGSEGFSVIDDAPTNLGLEDAAAALRWVHAEIASFGGDPNRITIMGESAGGAIVGGLLSRPEVSLVAGAIIESGPLSADPPARSGRVSKILAKKLGVPATREGFSSVTPEQLLKARDEQMAGKTLLDGVPSFVYTLDPQTLPVNPADGVAAASVPLLIGTNQKEHSLWFAPEVEAKTNGFRLWLVTKVLGISKSAVQAAKKAYPDASTGGVLGQLLTELLFRAPAIKAARARTAPTYVYEFHWPSTMARLGATHALEVPFVFNALPAPESETMWSGGPTALAERMHANWVQFIKEGKTDWPAFNEGSQVRIFNTEDSLAGISTPELIDALIK